MSRSLSFKYYQENKDSKKKLMKDIKIFQKKKIYNMVVNITKISQMMKKNKPVEY